MAQKTFDRYFEAEVLSADPMTLVNLLYRGALEAVSAARANLLRGEIPERSKNTLKAWAILQELNTSLDHAQGGELSGKLAALYLYMQERLLESNAEQRDEPLEEVESLLSTLAEAWQDLVSLPQEVPSAAVATGESQPLRFAY